MPRNVRYRKEFQAQNDVFWRLDVIPGDDTVFNYASASTEILGDETVLTIGDIQINYRDELCFGLPEYGPLTVSFNLDTIPSDLKSYLAVGFKPGTENTELFACNIVILWSSQDNITYTPVYVGVQTPQLTSEITISSNDTSVTKINFQPIQTAVFTRSKWNLLNKYFDDPDTFEFRDFDYYYQDYIYSLYEWTDTENPGNVWNEGPSVEFRLTNQFGNTNNLDNFWVYPYPLKNIFEVIRREMQAVFKYLTRQAATIVRSNADKTTNYLDWEYNRYIGADGVIKVRRAQNSISDLFDRLGDYCTFNEITVPMIIDPGHPSDTTFIFSKAKYVAQPDTNRTAGGIFNSNDAGSFPNQYKTFAEFIVNLSEWACSKMRIDFTYVSNVLKMKLEVFGALEKTNTTLPVTFKLFEISSSEALTAEIGYICSSIETGNARATTKLPSIPPQSPVLEDLAKSQSFSIKNNVFSWDVNVVEPNAQDNMQPSVGEFGRKYRDLGLGAQVFKGFYYYNKTPIPCTTLFYGLGTLKVTEYMQAGDTTKGISENIVYYETTGFDPASLGDIFNLSTPGGNVRYLDVYQWSLRQHIEFGTATQMNKLFSKILTNPKNWVLRDAEVYHLEQIDLGMPNKLIGHKIENDIPIAYDPLLDLPNKGIISSVTYEILTGKYTLSTFQVGLLME